MIGSCLFVLLKIVFNHIRYSDYGFPCSSPVPETLPSPLLSKSTPFLSHVFLVPFLWLFFPICLFSPCLPYLICLYPTLSDYYSLDACLFLMRDRKGVDADRRQDGEELRRIGGGENIVRLYCMKKNIFNKREKEKKPGI